MGDNDKAQDSGQKPEKKADSAGVDTVKIDPVINRRSRWVSSAAALRYVTSIQNDHDLKVRDSDKATAIALLACCFIALVCLVVPGFENFRVTFVLSADLLVGISLLMYVANRFGIVTTFQPRQALLTWQLMLGASLLGIFLTINLALLIAFFIANNQALILSAPSS
ncbi:MAG: hypothetical protein K2W95_10640 [Candidatus Obscuribacterales bacterium]|nr:hypothetical protein [Candidatus Obscuribacterales bacterium]